MSGWYHYSPACPMCDCDNTEFMGTLGTLDWFRCFDCGMEFNKIHDDGDGENDN